MNRNICCRIAMVLLCVGMASPAFANWMGGFVLDHGAASHLGHSEQARVTFDFKVTNAAGARFIVEGYHNGSKQPGGFWGGSATYPAGTVGSHSNYLSFNAGNVPVDQYRITMFEPGTLILLLEIYLPVEYFFGPHAINDIQMSHSSPSWLTSGESLTIDFAYQTDEPGGVRFSARPFNDGVLVSGYGASGSGLLPVGTGTYSQDFQFSNLERDVDEVRFQMFASDFSTLLLEFFVPVDLHWGPNGISNITFDPPYPECLAWDQPVTVEFDYSVDDPAGCYGWARGLDADHDLIIGQSYTGSPLEGATGHLVRQFRILPDMGEGEFSYVRITLNESTNTSTVLEVDLPVAYPYGPNVIQNVSFYPASPAVLDHGEHVETHFDYETMDPAGVRLYNYPYFHEAIVPDYAISGSILYMGSGSATSYFTVSSGAALVNRARMFMTEADASTLLMECFVECDFTFGGVGGVTPVRETPAANGPVLMQNYPNPFNPMTRIPVQLDQAGRVVLNVYDLRGHLMLNLADAVLPAGRNEILFDGRDLASGAYFYMLETPQGRQTKRMMLVK